jgi:hypothetical protein
MYKTWNYLGIIKQHDKKTNKCTNLNNLYFAHCWLNHTILKVVANDTFRQVKTHAAANGRKITDRTGYAWLQNETAVGRYIEMKIVWKHSLFLVMYSLHPRYIEMKICMEEFTVPSYVLPPPQKDVGYLSKFGCTYALNGV